MSPKVLLLQARRAEDRMRAHEHDCFVARTGLPEENLVDHDLCLAPPTMRQLKRFDALMVGGSGDFYVSRGDLPHFEGLLEFLREVVDAGYPTFASCFGYQSMVLALGGEVVFDPPNTEVGTYELTLTEDGRNDSLFGSLPSKIAAQMGHKDRASRHPDAVPNLAASANSPFQALRIPGKPIWATQFHPELDRATNVDRFHHYMDGYATCMTAEERQRALSRFGESPETSALLPAFLDLVFA